MSDLKSFSEELSTYIADAEKCERLVEAFRQMAATATHGSTTITVAAADFEKLRAIADE